MSEYLNRFSFEKLKLELEKLYIGNDVCGFYKLTSDEWTSVFNEFCKQEKIQTN